MESNKYECMICKNFYNSNESLFNHIEIFHNNENVKKIKCDKCSFSCNIIDELKIHNNKDCRPSVNSNNIYKFKKETLGENKYKYFNGGDIYIIQTEFNLKNYYKIGISTNLCQRLRQYRCGSVLEPKLHCYFPCKNIREADTLLKKELKKYNVKREIYKIENLEEVKGIIKSIQNKMNSEELEIVPEIKECEIISCKYCEIHFNNKIDLICHEYEHIIKNNTIPKLILLINNQENNSQDHMYEQCNEFDESSNIYLIKSKQHIFKNNQRTSIDMECFLNDLKDKIEEKQIINIKEKINEYIKNDYFIDINDVDVEYEIIELLLSIIKNEVKMKLRIKTITNENFYFNEDYTNIKV